MRRLAFVLFVSLCVGGCGGSDDSNPQKSAKTIPSAETESPPPDESHQRGAPEGLRSAQGNSPKTATLELAEAAASGELDRACSLLTPTRRSAITPTACVAFMSGMAIELKAARVKTVRVDGKRARVFLKQRGGRDLGWVILRKLGNEWRVTHLFD